MKKITSAQNTREEWINIKVPKSALVEIFEQTEGKKTLRELRKMSKREIIEMIHQTRRRLLKENPHAYIAYNA